MPDWSMAYGDEIRRCGDDLDEEWLQRNSIQVGHSRAMGVMGAFWTEDHTAAGGERMEVVPGVVVSVCQRDGITHTFVMDLPRAMSMLSNVMEAVMYAYAAANDSTVVKRKASEGHGPMGDE